MTELIRFLTIYIFLSNMDLSYTFSEEPRLKINKCCEAYELLHGDRCIDVNYTRSTIWEPGLKSPYT